MILSTCCIFRLQVFAEDDITNFSGGDGSIENPYKVSTAAQLNNVRNFLNKHFKQTCDIDLTEYTNWVPIGKFDIFNDKSFNGSYDGNGFSISNLHIDDVNSPFSNSSLFGDTTINSKFSNINLKNIDIYACSEKRDSCCVVGGLISRNRGSCINKCTVDGKITINAPSTEVGGLIGLSYGLHTQIMGCSSNCNIEVRYPNLPPEDEPSNYANVGGLVGYVEFGESDSVVDNCTSSGTIYCDVANDSSIHTSSCNAAGLIGIAELGIMSNCVSDTSITVISNTKDNVSAGGVVGTLGLISMKNCSSSGTISIKGGDWSNAGGLAGDDSFCSSPPLIEGCHSSVKLTCSDAVDAHLGGLLGYTSRYVSILSISNCYCTGDVNCYNSSIESMAGGFIGHFDSGMITQCHSTGNVDCSGYNSWAGGFGAYILTGSVDQNYSTGNVDCNGSYSWAGGFGGYIGNGTAEQNYSTGNINSSASVYSYAGGFGGYIENGSVNQNCSTGDTFSSGTQYAAAGGLLGYIDKGSNVLDSYSTGNASTKTDTQNGGRERAGGLIGVNSSSNIKNCYSIGVPNVSTVTDPLTNANIGGLLGRNPDGSIEQSYYDSYTSEMIDTGKGNGTPTPDMMKQNTFKGWDFDSTWSIEENKTYPSLKWKSHNIDDDINLASTALTWSVIKGSNKTMSDVTMDLVDPLPAMGTYGTTVSWKSDPEGFIDTTSGKVKRPSTKIGDKQVKLTAEIGKAGGVSKTKDFYVTIKALASGDDPTPTTPTTPTTTPSTPTEDDKVIVIINDKEEKAATAVTETVGNKKVTTVTLDDKAIEAKLNNGLEEKTVVIPVNTGADVVVGQLNGQTVKNMETKDAVLEIKTENVTYTLPAALINIDAVSGEIGKTVELKDIKVKVIVAEPPKETERLVEDTANKNNYQVVVKPVEFSITCSSGAKTVDVSKFSGYVERTVAIPDGIDPSKITTGIVLNSDGTFSHVPTTILKISGKYYAKINSLTNSTYSVIWSPKTFKDVENNWAKDSINDMGSRLIISGIGNDNFGPDLKITRAEFAAIVVRALGLMRPGTGKDSFSDVSKDDWYYDAVSLAYQYGIISGCENNQFKPLDNITREQAMSMIARAMKITGLKVDLNEGDVKSLFKDSSSVSKWAKDSIAACTKAGIVPEVYGDKLAPLNKATRAEIADMVRKLLQKSGLI